MTNKNPSDEPPTLLEWAIEHGSLLVFGVERVEGSWGGNGGEWRLTEVVVPS